MNHRQVWELTRYQSGMVVRGDMTIHDAAAQFIVSECDIMVVTDDHGLLLGVITEGCIVRALLSGPPEDAAIAGWIHRNVDSVRENSDLQSVLPLFRLSCHSAVPVVNQDQKVCGLLRRQDVLAEMLSSSPSRRSSAARSDVTITSGCADNPTYDMPVRTNHGEKFDSDTSRITRIDSIEAAMKEDRSAPLQNESVASSPGASSEAVRRSDAASTSNTKSLPNDGKDQRPHFLSGDDARRRLQPTDDWRNGSWESPW
jgi:hypothetical protein